MVNAIEDPRLVVVDTVLLDGVVGVLLLQQVHHLDLVKVDHGTTKEKTTNHIGAAIHQSQR